MQSTSCAAIRLVIRRRSGSSRGGRHEALYYLWNFICNASHGTRSGASYRHYRSGFRACRNNSVECDAKCPSRWCRGSTGYSRRTDHQEEKLRVGQRFQMAVSGDVTQNGVVIIPSGTPAIGEITEIRNKGMWGKSGYIGARAVSLRLGDRHVRLTGNFDDKGITGTGGVIAAVVLIPIAGFITTGTSAFIASGSGVKSFLDEDIAFQTVPAAVPTLQVPISAVKPAAVDADVPPTP